MPTRPSSIEFDAPGTQGRLRSARHGHRSRSAAAVRPGSCPTAATTCRSRSRPTATASSSCTTSIIPGWEVYVDGERRPILRANLLFRGVEVPPGRHRVEFRFRPLSVDNLVAAATDLMIQRARDGGGDRDPLRLTLRCPSPAPFSVFSPCRSRRRSPSRKRRWRCRRSPAPGAPAERSTVQLSAVFAGEQRPVPSGLIWRLYEEKLDGSQPTLVEKSTAPTPSFSLRPGNYIVHAAYGFAGSSRSASRCRAASWSSASPSAPAPSRWAGPSARRRSPPNRLAFSVYVPIGSNSEGRLVVGNVRGGEVIRLPEGTYHVVSTYGEFERHHARRPQASRPAASPRRPSTIAPPP